MPNSNFVSASSRPCSAARAAPRRYSSRDASRTSSASARPSTDTHVSKSMFSSFSPRRAFVDGVKIGSGSLADSARPGGSVSPHTAPDLR